MADRLTGAKNLVTFRSGKKNTQGSVWRCSEGVLAIRRQVLRRLPSRVSRVAIGLLVLLAVYGLIAWFWIRPAAVQTWRESDTQTIAVHLAEPGASIWYPRIAWGGRGPGYVETEFQLYTFVVARLLPLTGDLAWPGQLVSLLATLAAACVVFRALAPRHGELPALLGTLALLSSRGVTLVATSVQPEALCLLLYAAAWFAFVRYEAGAGERSLIPFALCGGLAMLVKPTAAQLGISTFCLVFFSARQRFKSAALWAAWGSMLLSLALYLLHARGLYLRFGNTFGVLSGGDSKLPHLSQLQKPILYFAAAANAVKWGAGPVASMAVAAVLLLRRGTAQILALLLGNALWTVLALRYTATAAGNHYHVLGAVLGAQAVASLAEWALAERRAIWLSAGLGAALSVWLLRSLQVRHATRYAEYDVPAIEAARALAAFAPKGALVVVRSVEDAYDPFWQTANNFQDPRVFYLSKTHGFAVGLDNLQPEAVAQPARMGARFYVETIPRFAAPELDTWLASHARLLASTPHGGRVFALE